jgi:hypothetical protein
MSKRLIFGLGTGRCGTMSLATLLNDQQGCMISHELGGGPWLAWEPSIDDLDTFMDRIMNRTAPIVGDVSFYSLPYANILMDRYDDVRFVILKRDKEETIESYMRKTVGRNHFTSHNGSGWRLDIWDRCYPKFNVETKEEALSRYYDHYYELCQQLPQDKCFWMQLPQLNDVGKCLEMLEFCGIENPRFKMFKKNRGK